MCCISLLDTAAMNGHKIIHRNKEAFLLLQQRIQEINDPLNRTEELDNSYITICSIYSKIDNMAYLLDYIEPDYMKDHMNVAFAALQCIFTNLPPPDKAMLFHQCLGPGALTTDRIVTKTTGVIYYYAKLYPRTFDLCETLSDDTPLGVMMEGNIRSILTLAAKTSAINLLALDSSSGCTCCANIVDSAVKDAELLMFDMVDIGHRNFNYSNQAMGKFTFFQSAIHAVRTNPYSLLQIARLAIRRSMRDVHVLEDCYKLPIPKSLQDYVSLRSLKAPIRSWFLKSEIPSLAYDNYNAQEEVLARYNIDLPV